MYNFIIQDVWKIACKSPSLWLLNPLIGVTRSEEGDHVCRKDPLPASPLHVAPVQDSRLQFGVVPQVQMLTNPQSSLVAHWLQMIQASFNQIFPGSSFRVTVLLNTSCRGNTIVTTGLLCRGFQPFWGIGTSKVEPECQGTD